MDEQVTTRRMARELRFLKLYAIFSSLAIGLLLFLALAPASRRIEVLDVQRINVRHSDGKLALAIAGQGMLPGPAMDGKSYPQHFSGGRVQASGIIFFNERGDEVGGLTFNGNLTEDGYRAGGGITFDQFRQDQVVSLQYSDNGSRRSAGVTVWDRSTEIPLSEVIELIEARSKAQGAALDSINNEIQGLAERGLAATRVFLGSQNRTAQLLLRDTRGRPRIRLFVDSMNVAGMEFLDSTGVVTGTFPK